MSADQKLERTISSWLEADAPSGLPDRVLSATFERTRRARQQRRWRAVLGRTQVNRSILVLGGAAVAVIAAVVALNFMPEPPGVGGTPPPASVMPTDQPSVPMPSAAAPGEADLLEGPYVLWEDAGMTVTIPAPGWRGDQRILTKNDVDPPAGAGIILFGLNDEFYVYGDPCRWSTTRPETPVTTVDGLVAALSAQASRDATAPVDVTVDGHDGKSITLHVRDDADFSECDQGLFGTWAASGDPSPSRYHQGPGQIDKIWILDVDGVLVVVDTTYYSGTPEAVVAELDAIVESATFE